MLSTLDAPVGKKVPSRSHTPMESPDLAEIRAYIDVATDS